jgi:hypothetical protein
LYSHDTKVGPFPAASEQNQVGRRSCELLR